MFPASRGLSRRGISILPRRERPLLVGNKKDSAFKNCPPLYQTNNRNYMSQSEIKETGQAWASLLFLLNKRDAHQYAEGYVNVSDLP